MKRLLTCLYLVLGLLWCNAGLAAKPILAICKYPTPHKELKTMMKMDINYHHNFTNFKNTSHDFKNRRCKMYMFVDSKFGQILYQDYAQQGRPYVWYNEIDKNFMNQYGEILETYGTRIFTTDKFFKEEEKKAKKEPTQTQQVAKKEEASWLSRVKKWYLGKEQSQTQQVAKKMEGSSLKVFRYGDSGQKLYAIYINFIESGKCDYVGPFLSTKCSWFLKENVLHFDLRNAIFKRFSESAEKYYYGSFSVDLTQDKLIVKNNLNQKIFAELNKKTTQTQQGAKKEKKKTKKVAKDRTYHCVAQDKSFPEQYLIILVRCPSGYKSVSADEYANFKKQKGKKVAEKKRLQEAKKAEKKRLQEEKKAAVKAAKDIAKDTSTSITKQIKELNKLYKKGFLTEEEFKEAKKQIINN